MPKRICETCGSEFYEKANRPGRFCRRECYLQSLPRKPEVTCEGCGERFQPSPKSRSTRRFCSRACYSKTARGETHSCFQANAATKPCPECGCEFRVTGSEEDRRFCTEKCWRAYQVRHPANGLGICPCCGVEFKRLKAGQSCCSLECRSAHFTGRHSPSWKGGEYEASVDEVTYVNTGEVRRDGSLVYARKHRLIVEQAIGRKLFADEKIWHIDRNRRNNALENLYIFQCQGEMVRAIATETLPTRSNIIRGEPTRTGAGTVPRPENHACDSRRPAYRGIRQAADMTQNDAKNDA